MCKSVNWHWTTCNNFNCNYGEVLNNFKLKTFELIEGEDWHAISIFVNSYVHDSALWGVVGGKSTDKQKFVFDGVFSCSVFK